ncbi:MAG TPA: hypothetical protein VJS68_04420, partial [Thermoplasmata archaeon]|nr:hypothetical protein [Thermoplasmata archaeon]
SDRGITLVAKGAPDLLSDGVRSASNLTHHAAGSVGGAGDLLAGTLAHLLGEGLTGWEAARLGAHWIGSAGVAAYGTKSYGLTATDILSEMPTTLRESLARVEVFRTGPTRARRSGPGP